MAAGSLQSPVSWTWTPCSPGAAFWTSMSTTTPDAVGVMRAVPEVLLPLRGSSTAVATGVGWAGAPAAAASLEGGTDEEAVAQAPARTRSSKAKRDRKSTRLNSSHGYISYAVFCLKKKKKEKKENELDKEK